jgi:hypothetical protein
LASLDPSVARRILVGKMLIGSRPVILDALTAENCMMPEGELLRSQESVNCPYSP